MSCGLQLLHPPIVMSTPPAPPPNLPFSEHHALPGLLCGMEAAREKWVSWLHPTPMTLYPQGFWDRSPRASWASQGAGSCAASEQGGGGEGCWKRSPFWSFSRTSSKDVKWRFWPHLWTREGRWGRALKNTMKTSTQA